MQCAISSSCRSHQPENVIFAGVRRRMPQPIVFHEIDGGLLEQEEVRGPDGGGGDDGGGQAARPVAARAAAENGYVQYRAGVAFFAVCDARSLRLIPTSERPLSCITSSGPIGGGGGGKCSDDNRRESRSRRSRVMPSLSLGEGLPPQIMYKVDLGLVIFSPFYSYHFFVRRNFER